MGDSQLGHPQGTLLCVPDCSRYIYQVAIIIHQLSRFNVFIGAWLCELTDLLMTVFSCLYGGQSWLYGPLPVICLKARCKDIDNWHQRWLLKVWLWKCGNHNWSWYRFQTVFLDRYIIQKISNRLSLNYYWFLFLRHKLGWEECSRTIATVSAGMYPVKCSTKNNTCHIFF